MTKKEELIKELNQYKDWFTQANIDENRVEFLDEGQIRDKLYFIKTLKSNREKLNALNIEI